MLAVIYPFLAHAAVVGHSDSLTAASLACLALAGLAPGLRERRAAAFFWAAALGAGIAALYRAHIAGLPLYAPPIVVDVSLATLFGLTLRRGQTPLIERLVRLLHAPDEELHADILRYARRLTAAWAILFVLLALIDAALALCTVPGGILHLAGIRPPVAVSPATWSLFANFMGLAIVAIFFLLEYAYRRRRFPQQPYRNIFDFLERAARVGRQAVWPGR